MPAFRRFATAVIVAAFLGGCALQSSPPKAVTFAQKEAEYSAKLQRIVLVCPAAQGTDRLNVYPVIARELRSKGVVVEVVVPDPLELNKGHAVRLAAAKIGATQVVLVQSVAAGNRVTTSGQFRNMDGSETFETSVQALPSAKVVWRARTMVGYSRIRPDEREDVVAKSISEKLTADALL